MIFIRRVRREERAGGRKPAQGREIFGSVLIDFHWNAGGKKGEICRESRGEERAGGYRLMAAEGGPKKSSMPLPGWVEGRVLQIARSLRTQYKLVKITKQSIIVVVIVGYLLRLIFNCRKNQAVGSRQFLCNREEIDSGLDWNLIGKALRDHFESLLKGSILFFGVDTLER